MFCQEEPDNYDDKYAVAVFSESEKMIKLTDRSTWRVMAGGHRDSTAQGMKKITRYFAPVPCKTEAGHILQCFESCLHLRADEEKGNMSLCDGCASWFHEEFVTAGKMNGLGPKPTARHGFALLASWFLAKSKKLKKSLLSYGIG